VTNALGGAFDIAAGGGLEGLQWLFRKKVFGRSRMLSTPPQQEAAMAHGLRCVALWPSGETGGKLKNPVCVAPHAKGRRERRNTTRHGLAQKCRTGRL